MSKILSNLYLGQLEDIDPTRFDFNIDLSYPYNGAKNQKTILEKKGRMTSVKIGINDQANSRIDKLFNILGKMIDANLRQGNKILVNCRAGVSRSPSIIIAYLMKYHKLSFKDALKYVMDKRSIVHPNPGFLRKLSSYEKGLNNDI